MAATNFSELFQKDDQVDPNVVVDLFESAITSEMNDNLCKPYNAKEISDALFQIGTLKASGTDGFHARFFQRNWLMIKEGHSCSAGVLSVRSYATGGE